jgi:hypothetical protein
MCAHSVSQPKRTYLIVTLAALRCLTLFARAASVGALSTAEYVAAHQAAQRIVDERWNAANFSSLPCARPRVHGHVTKAADNSQNPTLTIKAVNAKPLIEQGLPVYSGCRVCTCSTPSSRAPACLRNVHTPAHARHVMSHVSTFDTARSQEKVASMGQCVA